MTLMSSIVGLYFLGMAISTFTGVDWYRSLWDGHERMLGLFTMGHYVLYYLILTHTIQKSGQWKRLAHVFWGISVIVILAGLWQRFIDPEAILNRGAERVSSTLGNPIYLSALGLFVVFLSLHLLVQIPKRTYLTLWRSIYGFGIVIGIAGIFIGGTRGTFLGLLAGIALAIVLYFFLLKDSSLKKIRTYLGVLILSGIILVSGLFIFRTTPVVKQIPMVGSLLSIDISKGTASTRLMAWDIAVESWKEKPLFGWGVNNYYYAFNEYYRPAFLEHGWGETWFDNAHSMVFNTLNTKGIYGLLFYLGLFAGAGYQSFLLYKKEDINIHTYVIISGFLVAHFVHNIFVFENPTSYIYFFFILAFLNHKFALNKKDMEEKKMQTKKVSTPQVLSVLVVIVFVIFVTNVNPARANNHTLKTIRTIYSNPHESVQMFEDVDNLYPSPHIDDIRNDYAQNVTRAMPQFLSQGYGEEVKILLEASQKGLEKNMKLHPLDIRIYLSQSAILQALASVDQNITFLIQKEQSLKKALSYSPQRQQIIYELATVQMVLKNHDAAVDLLQKVVDDNKNIAESWVRLAAAYNDMGEKRKAQEILSEATDHGIIFGEDYQPIIQSIQN